MSRITINKGSFQIGQRQINNGTITIGRSKANDVPLDDTTVSGCHAKIVTVMNTSYVQDLDSTNGTYVNGEKVKQRVLKPNDVVGIGKHEILFLSNQQSKSVEPDEDVDRTQLLTVSNGTGMQSVASGGMQVNAKSSMSSVNAKVANYAEDLSVEPHIQVTGNPIRVVVDNTPDRNGTPKISSFNHAVQEKLNDPEPVINFQETDEILEEQPAQPEINKTPATPVAKATSYPVNQIKKTVISDFESVHFDNNYRDSVQPYASSREISRDQMVRQIIMTEKEMGSISKLKTFYILLGLATLIIGNIFIFNIL